MKDRIPIFNDIRVLAAIEALKHALLQVNGDARAKSLIVQADLRLSEDAPENRLVAYSDICPCAACTGNMKRQFHDILKSYVRADASLGGVVH
jgi:hypothetical protein